MPSNPPPNDEQLHELIRKAIVSKAFELAQPNRGDAFSWLDDHADDLAQAALSSIPRDDELLRLREALTIARNYVVNVVEAEDALLNKRDLALIDAALTPTQDEGDRG